MKVLFHVIPVLLLPLACLSVSAQTADSIASNFLKQSVVYPQEKLYIQNDKPCYITGEDIWFRAHLVDAQSHLPDTTSRYVYVELVNPADSVVSRVKVRPQNGAYHGYITLAQDLPEGDYQLRSYTRFMEGVGEDYFFRKTITVGDPLSALYNTHTSFRYDDRKRKADLEIYFTEAQGGRKIKPENIKISDDNGTLRSYRPDEDSVVSVSRKAPGKGKSRVLYLEYDYAGKFHKQYIPIPYPEGEFDVSFMPEGGNFPAGILHQIAFKAIASNGLGEDISGDIVNEKGDTVTSFSSAHLGMGVLTAYANAGEKLFAVCRNKSGVEKKFTLPEATGNTLSLRTTWQKDYLNIILDKSADIASSDAGCYLIVHCRGMLVYAEKWSDEKSRVRFEQNDLPSGVIQILLADSLMNPLSERLVFNFNEIDKANITFDTDKANYGKREKVQGRIALKDNAGNPLQGSFSVSVTDDADVQPDSCVNILSSLLLTSELKGYVESPASYFKDGNANINHSLDRLMMTQGWRRYNINKVLKGEFDTPGTALEIGQTISGMVKGGLLMNKAASGYTVTIVSLRDFLYGDAVTDENGRFAFHNFEFPDSTKYIVQAKTKKGGSRAELLLDKEMFPAADVSYPLTFKKAGGAFESYMQKADEKFIQDNGMRMIYLKDVEVTAQVKSKRGKSPYSSGFSTIITAKDIEATYAQDIFGVLPRYGVRVVYNGSGRDLSIRGGGTPLILLDGVSIDIDMLQNMPVTDIDEIEIFKGAEAAIFGMRGGNGAIVLTTKTGEGVGVRESIIFNVKNVTPLGYQVTKEFYSPKYETRQQREDSAPDLRTTIYWNPDVKASAGGQAGIDFYSADMFSGYSVVIEGVTSDGRLIHAMKKIPGKD